MVFKKKEKLYERGFVFDYEVDFIDGAREIRTGWVKAMHIENALDRASRWIEERVESDDLIEDATLIMVERED